MRISWLITPMICVSLVCATGLRAQPAPNAPDPDAQKALAERLTLEAQTVLRGNGVSESDWQMATALLEGAVRLAPDEPRFLRLLVEAQHSLGETEAEINTLRHIYDLDKANQPGQRNQSVLPRLIDLNLKKIETIDNKLDYLTGLDKDGKTLIDKLDGAPTAQSHVCLRAAELMQMRAAPAGALQAVERAIKLNPLNPAALQLRWTLLPANTPPEQRLAALLQMVRACPRNLTYCALLAEQLGSMGWVNESLDWYKTAAMLSQKTQTAPAGNFAFQYAAELFVSGNSRDALAVLDGLLKVNPNDVDAWFLKCTISRADDPAAVYEKTRADMRDVFRRRLTALRKAAQIPDDGSPKAFDFVADAKVVNAQSPLAGDYISVASDIASFCLYFDQNPEESRSIIDFVATLLPPGSQTLARLQGWQFMLDKKPDQAKVKFDAIADRDELAELGRLRILGTGNNAYVAGAQKLLSRAPSGLVGAILWGELKGPGVRILAVNLPRATDNDVLDYTHNWIKILDNPGQFYDVRTHCLTISCRTGQPMLAEITIVNRSKYDLSIDANGTISPAIWVNVVVKGPFDGRSLSGVAFEWMSGRVVLPAGADMKQTVRIDQVQLSRILQLRPAAAIPVFPSVLTNPISIKIPGAADANGQPTAPVTVVVPGPAGVEQPFTGPFERRAENIAQDAKLLTDLRRDLDQKSDTVKLQCVDLLATWIEALGSVKDPNAEQLIRDFRSLIDRQRDFGTAGVQPWAALLSARVASDPADRKEILRQMRASGRWESKLLGLLVVERFNLVQALPEVQKLATDDPEPIVKRMAGGVAFRLQHPTTQPTTQPGAASQPAEASNVESSSPLLPASSGAIPATTNP